MKPNRKHRSLALLLIFSLILSFTACSSKKTDSPVSSEKLTTAHETTSAPETTTAAPETKPAAPKFKPITPEQRAYRTQLNGGNEDVVTLMVYLCGSDLESRGGTATIDLGEIMSADISPNLNIIVETGGALAWQNKVVSADTNERWKVTNDGLELLTDVGMRNMSSGSTLIDFIKYSAEQFPADRYMLVLWDHGGGTVGGYAYDERYENNDMMSISELNLALAYAGVTFDMIGFDCCLMSTAETAFMIEKYADYMVSSQRTEPGNGWHYTPWINALSKNTSIPTEELGAVIVDSYIEACKNGYSGRELTLSVIDLTYIPDLFKALDTFFAEAEGSLIDDKTFITTSQALGQSRAINDNEDLVDLVYLVESMGGSEELLDRLNQCVVYNGATIADHNGLCLYFPYRDLSKVSDALEIYDQIGINDNYQSFITTFANLMIGGQAYQNGGTQGPMSGTAYEASYWLGLDWVNEELFANYNTFFAENSYDGTELAIEEKGDGYVLSLSDEDWELITTVEQRVFIDDEDGFIDLGSDSIYEFDDDGDLLIEFDNTWVALDSEIVCFYTMEYFEDGDEWYSWGVAPVLYEDEDAELVIMWDNENPSGYVAGWRSLTTGGSSQKGLFPLEDGMRFDIVCEFYTYDGEYDGQYLWGEIVIDGPPAVSYEDVGDADCEVYYELYDIYQNTYWSESVIYSLDS